MNADAGVHAPPIGVHPFLSVFICGLLPSRLTGAAIGDMLVHGGTPGHAVLIVDLAVEPANGRKVAMLAQGFMPAQNVHVLRNPLDPALSPWFALADDRPIVMPEWRLRPDELRRF